MEALLIQTQILKPKSCLRLKNGDKKVEMEPFTLILNCQTKIAADHSLIFSLFSSEENIKSFSLKNNEKVFMNIVCSHDWHFKG